MRPFDAAVVDAAVGLLDRAWADGELVVGDLAVRRFDHPVRLRVPAGLPPGIDAVGAGRQRDLGVRVLVMSKPSRLLKPIESGHM